MMLHVAPGIYFYGSFAFCHCLFLSFCFFISISLVDKGGTEAQGCVTTVSWHGVWSWVIVAGLQSVRGISSLCYPRAGNQAWAAVSQPRPPRSPVLPWGKFPCGLCHSLVGRKKSHTEYRSRAHLRVIDLWLRAKRVSRQTEGWHFLLYAASECPSKRNYDHKGHKCSVKFIQRTSEQKYRCFGCVWSTFTTPNLSVVPPAWLGLSSSVEHQVAMLLR